MVSDVQLLFPFLCYRSLAYRNWPTNARPVLEKVSHWFVFLGLGSSGSLRVSCKQILWELDGVGILLLKR